MNLKDHILNKDVFTGIYDFSYAPYALGDAITWQVNLCVKSIDAGKRGIAQYIVADPNRPSFPLQKYITVNNYIEYVNNLFPVFLCCPDTISISIIKDKVSFDLSLFKSMFHCDHMWPSLVNHFFGKLDYYSHGLINDFFRRNGYIPRLKPPRGYEASVDDFINKYCSGRFIVSVNVRQRKFYQDLKFLNSKIVLNRDSELSEWYSFFKIVGQKYPDVVFLIFGGYMEWERELYNYGNVMIPRAMGFNLAHELTFLHKSNLFMGTSSGFAAMATFSEVPYIITNYEHAAAKNVDIPLYAIRYPFALDHQILSWERETKELLLDLFEPVYSSLKTN